MTMPEQQTNVRIRIKYKKPRLYKVIMYNDNVTTMDFVVMVLQTVFNKQKDVAEEMMMHIHKNGQCVVGVYTFDVARTKVSRTKMMAIKAGFPLKLDYKPE